MFKFLTVFVLALALVLAGCAGIVGSKQAAMPFQTLTELKEGITELKHPPLPVAGGCTGNDNGAVVTADSTKGSFRVIVNVFEQGKVGFIFMTFDEQGNVNYVWGGKIVNDRFVVLESAPIDEWVKKYGENPCDALIAFAGWVPPAKQG